MSDNTRGGSQDGANPLIATDEVTYSGETADVQLVRVVGVSGAEGSKTVDDIDTAVGLKVTDGSATYDDGSADGNLTDIIGLTVYAYPRVFNGTTWDRLRGDTGGLFAQGNVAHDAVDAGNPIKIGGKYTATPVDVADGDRVNARFDSDGALLIRHADGSFPIIGDNPSAPVYVEGNIAHDAVDAGNPVKIGAIVDLDGRTAGIAAGDRANIVVDQFSRLSVISGEAISGADGDTNTEARTPTVGGTNVFPAATHNYVFNGTTWDRLRGNTNGLFTQGNVAHDTADSGNPVKIGGKAASSAPTVVTEGDRVNAWFGLNGQQNVHLVGSAGDNLDTGLSIYTTLIDTAAREANVTQSGADATNNSALNALQTISYGWLYNGTSWDRTRSLPALDTAAASPRTGIIAAQAPDHRYTSVSLGTAASSTQSWVTNGADEVLIRVGTGTTGTMTFEVSADDSNWVQATVRDTQTALWANAAFTPTSGKTYRIVTPGWRTVRARTVTTLGATVALIATAHADGSIINAVNTGPAPHDFGYAETAVSAQYTSAQTSTTLGPTVSSTQRMVVTYIQIQSYGTTAGTCIVYFGTGAYSRGTNKAIFDGEWAPSSTLKPGFTAAKPNGWIGALDEELKVTTTNAQSVTVTIWYYLV